MAQQTITCRCKHCGTKFRVKAELAGRKGRCPNEQCRKVIVVPGADPVDLPEPLPERTAPTMPRPQADRAAAGRKKPAGKSQGASAKSPLPLVVAAVVGLAIVGGVVAFGPFGGSAEAPVADAGTEVETVPVSLPPEDPGPPSFKEAIGPFLEANCFDCHGGDEPEGDLNLTLDHSADDVLANRARWEKAYDMIRIGAMPPPDYATPGKEEVAAVSTWLDDTLYHVDCQASPDPGRVTIRRLNKTEYTNTVQDLLGITFDPAKGFPSDEVGYGFDNIGDVLTVPPLLLEKYLDAAEQIASKAILHGDTDLQIVSRDVNRLKATDGAYPDKGDGYIAMATSGGKAVFQGATFSRAGEYVIRVSAGGEQAGDEPVRLELTVDGKSLGEIDVEAPRGQGDSYDVRHRFEAGNRSIAVTFVNDFYKKRVGDRNAYVYSIELIGPYGVDKTKLPASHKRLTETKPGKGVSAFDAAMANLKPLVRLAFRRKVSDAEVEPFARFAALADERGEPFEAAMQVAVQAVLVSPQFLFRVETDDGSTGSLARRLNPYEVASRLSYFLWNTTPDDRLLGLAESNQLLRTEVLEAEVARLLEDPRSEEMVGNFVGQWLGLRRLSELAPDTQVFPEFDRELRASMASETEQFVQHVLRTDRPITELLSARYSFLNGRLARHYGIEGVEGSEFRKVDLVGVERAGLLTQASVLLLTSYPNRTSPVKRGEWVLTNILGDEPPPAPPNVPTLEETQASSKGMTLRQQMAKHREDPSCAACHKTMDAIGFGFENYDAIGRWRDKDGDNDVDASGELPSGEKFGGAMQLVDVLATREEAFVETFAERLLTFALGRGVEYTDRCVLDDIVADAKTNGNSFSAIVAAIVRSNAFRYQGAASPAGE